MLQRLRNAINLMSNMGWRYIAFRGKHELLRRSGLLKSKFPVEVHQKQWISLAKWKEQKGKFFFETRDNLKFPKQPSSALKLRFEEYKQGRLLFFNSLTFDLGLHYDWVTNPDNGFKYDVSKHWTDIPDYSKEAGDIKFVWEKSRFSFLYDIIRYDYHFDQDSSELVFKEIQSWIRSNPVNCGPNYRCSQEISLRVLNWVFALYYYSDSPALTNEVFDEIQNAIYWQLHHVYHNIEFSRIAVRNNHAITETMTLYLANIFFPGNEDIKIWSKKSKKWFEEEIAYQIYEDGSFLQFSMNYHRVVVQLLTWAIRISELNEMILPPVVYDRAKASLKFLRVCMDDKCGWLPNYGANDGALFFQLNNAHYRDYRPQLYALASALGVDAQIEGSTEDSCWFGGVKQTNEIIDLSPPIYMFRKGGYYLFRDKDTISFIRCGNHKDRPSQADNLHLDIWYKGENVLQDAGSYKYNTDIDLLKYFTGTASHNTVMINGYDQMQKGGRFIWYKWTQCVNAQISEHGDELVFSGTITAFRQLSSDIRHTRKVSKVKGASKWVVEDTIDNAPENIDIKQLWHFPLDKEGRLNIQAKDADGKNLPLGSSRTWYSGLYGQKEEQGEWSFVTRKKIIISTITIQ